MNDNQLGTDGFPYSVVSTLTSLVDLRLDSNGASVLPNFQSNEIVTLYLRENSIDTITTENFVGLSKMYELYMDNNRVQTITQGTEIILNIWSKEWTSLLFNSKGAFAGLDRFGAFHLEMNAVTRLTARTFENLERLTYIHMHQNPIKSIQTGMN